jgi:hypothetical protein
MQTKGALTLAAVAVVAAVVAVGTTIAGNSHSADPQVGKLVLPNVAPHLADVGKVVLKHEGGTITLVKRGNNLWTVAEKSDYPANAQKMRDMLLALAQLSYVEPKTSRPDLYARLNLDDPAQPKSQSIEVDLYDASGGALGSLVTGRRRVDELGGGNDGIYVRLPGNPQTWLARGNLDIDSDIVQWLDRRIVDVDDKRVKQAVLVGPDGATLTISRDKPEDKFALKELPADRKLKSDTVLVEPATVLQAFDLSDVKAAKDFTFPTDGVAKATYTTFDGLTIAVETAKVGDVDWMRLSATSDGSEQAKIEADTLNQRWSPWVYGVAPFKAAAVRTKLDDVLEPPKQTSQQPPTGAPTTGAPAAGAPATGTPATGAGSGKPATPQK